MSWFYKKSERKASHTMPNNTDLLELFKDTANTWDVLWCLYTHHLPGEQDFLCNKLLCVEEGQVEQYLSQLCYLVSILNSKALDRALTVLCEKSLRIAVKGYWLLNAAVEDRRDPHLVEVRDACERAGLLEGTWHIPFDDEQQLPLSPPRASQGGHCISPPSSPTYRPPSQETFSPRTSMVPPKLRCMSPEPILDRHTRATEDFLSPGGSSRPTSPVPFMVDPGMDGVIFPTYTDGGERPVEDGISRRSTMLDKQLGKGQGVSDLIERSSREPSGTLHSVCPEDRRGRRALSPVSARTEQLRQTTFSMTLDFIERLTMSSAKLAKYSRDVRPARLHKYLRGLNRMIAESARNGASCWFPLGSRNERIIQLAWTHAHILNSREKAPFLLHVEVLQATDDYKKELEILFSEEEDDEQLGDWEEEAAGYMSDDEVSDLPLFEPQPSAEDPTHLATGLDGPGQVTHTEEAGPSSTASTSSVLTSSPVASSNHSYLTPTLPTASSSPRARSPSPLDLNTHTLRDDSASPNHGETPTSQWRHSVRLEPQGRGGREPASPKLEAAQGRGGREPASLTLEAAQGRTGREPASAKAEAVSSRRRTADRRSGGILAGLLSPSRSREVADVAPAQQAQRDPEHLPRSLRAAASGLRGDGPAVSVELIVDDRSGGQYEDCSSGHSSDTSSSYRPQAVELRDMSKSQKEAAVQGSRLMQLLSSWGSFRAPEITTPAGSLKPCREPRVRVKLKVYGGVDLRLPDAPAKSNHRRVSSVEGLGYMEALLKNGTTPYSVPGHAHAHSHPHRHPSGAPRSRHVNRCPSTPPTQDRPAPKSHDRGSRQRTPLQDMANRLPGESPGAAARMYGSGPPSSSGRGPPAHVFGPLALNRGPRMIMSNAAMEDALKRQKEAIAIYGQSFEELTEQVRRESQFGQRPGWALRQVIVKSGDDCRQELLAVQLIRLFHDIFKRAELPIWVRPFEVLVVSSRTALIEVVPDAPSVHTIKAKGNYNSLADHFFAKFIRGSQECREAQYRFTESMAGYSLLVYFLAIKDRHNGNLLLANDGRLVHIDFGFMLSNAPGGLGGFTFETAPFKLTRELLEILDSDSGGRGSPMFDYFKVLFLQGFMACRAEAERVINLVSMMQNSGFPCFRGGQAAVDRLRQRFFLDKSDAECVELALGLIGSSLDAFSSRQYDYYQRTLNGIC